MNHDGLAKCTKVNKKNYNRISKNMKKEIKRPKKTSWKIDARPKNKKAPGPDGIPIEILKLTQDGNVNLIKNYLTWCITPEKF